jgi:hypothetical protein
MADPDLVRRPVTLLPADLPSQAIQYELTAWIRRNAVLDGWV